METTTVSEASATQGSSYAGTIEGTNAVALSFSSAGTIQRLDINEGQAVSRGQLLGTVDGTTTGNALLVAQVLMVLPLWGVLQRRASPRIH